MVGHYGNNILIEWWEFSKYMGGLLSGWKIRHGDIGAILAHIGCIPIYVSST
jgi:hypothetical protein